MGFYPTNSPQDASFAIGTEAADAIAVTVQLKDVGGTALDNRAHVRIYLSSNANGTAVATVPDGGAVVSGGVATLILTAGLHFLVQCSTAGQFILTITESTAKSFYLVVVLPNGQQVVSSAITFA